MKDNGRGRQCSLPFERRNNMSSFILVHQIINKQDFRRLVNLDNVQAILPRLVETIKEGGFVPEDKEDGCIVDFNENYCIAVTESFEQLMQLVAAGQVE